MKILVCMSVVPDTTTKITFTENNTQFNKQGVQFIINPYDELAITKALEITEKNGGEVVLIHVGTVENEAAIRKGLSMGAASAVRINAEAKDAQFVATEIANYTKSNPVDCILTGRESIDYNSGAVCALIAQNLNWPAINVVTKLEINGNIAQIEHDIDGGRESVTCNLPFVASAQKDLCEPRIPNMKGIMSARTKPLQVIEPINNAVNTNYENYELPAAKNSVKMFQPEQISDLMNSLRTEAKVL